MANERSKEQSANVPSRAAAHQPKSSGISHPAVQHPLEEPDTLPEQGPLPETKPFQLKPDSTVVQRVDKKRKRSSPKKKKDPPKKKHKVRHKAPEKMDQGEEEEEQAAPGVAVDEEEEELEPAQDVPLKFVAWNANHFGDGNNLSEGEIIKKIAELNGEEIIAQVKTWTANREGFTAAEITEYLQVLLAYTGGLPAYSDIHDVNKLMDAVKALNYIFKRLGDEGDVYFAGKYKVVLSIVGSLKKHYMIAHARHLMKVHPNLIMGFNEVGKGVDFMKEQLEKDSDAAMEEEESPAKEKGSKLVKGPKLQAVSIDVAGLNAAIEEYNDEHADQMSAVEVKKSYTDADLKVHTVKYALLDSPDDLLHRSQIEYYPVVFNEEKYEHVGFMAISSAGEEKKGAEIEWTKNPHLKYIKYRPIVVHKLKRKNANGKPAGNEIWYGMVHTSPEGDEFDRRDIYAEQLKKSLPELRSKARKAKAQLIVGGDYYIAEEALVKTPAVSRYRNKSYKKKVKNSYRLTKAQMRNQGLESNKSVGRLKPGGPDARLTYGKIDEVRNLLDPATNKPYNYKQTLERKFLHDARSLTGTNKNNTGLQSADYFIVDRRSSRTHQAGVIDPVTGLPHHMESEDNEISDAWFSFSDHVPVMAVVSGKKDDKRVKDAFASNKPYFHSEEGEHNMNPFDLRFLQVANIVTRILRNRDKYQPEDIEQVEQFYSHLLEQRDQGTYAENDLKLMSAFKGWLEKLTSRDKRRQAITAEMFETSQSGNAFITSILQQIWSDIKALGHQVADLLDYIQQVRMIIKEDKISAAYSLGLDDKDLQNRSAAAEETRAILELRLGKGSLAEIDKLHGNIKKPRKKGDADRFLDEKKRIQRVLLANLMEVIGAYITQGGTHPLVKGKQQFINVGTNFKLLEDIIGRKVIKSSLHADYENDIIDEAAERPEHQHRTLGKSAENGGIPNTGTDCFMNALCQLLSLPVYQHLALDGKVRQLVSKVGNQQSITKAEVRDLRLYLYALGLVDSMGRHEDTAELMGKLMDELDPTQVPNPQQMLQQHDNLFKYVAVDKRKILLAHDVSALHDSPNDPSAVPWIGGEKTTPQPPENILNISVTEAQGLIDWLNNPRFPVHTPDYSKRKTIDWALLDQQWVSVIKKQEETTFTRLPGVLTIALKRFDNDRNKLSNTFKMPPHFSLSEVQGPQQVMRKDYELKGFVYHQGETLRGGHYWAHKKDQYGNWLKANDASVGPSDMQGTGEGAFKHDLDNAYVYTYELTATNAAPFSPASSPDVEQD